MHQMNQATFIKSAEMQANVVASHLQLELDCADDIIAVLAEFHREMTYQKQDSYLILEIVGVGTLRDAFVWWFDDESILFVGWHDEDKVMTGVFPPGTAFEPRPLHEGEIQPLH